MVLVAFCCNLSITNHSFSTFTPSNLCPGNDVILQEVRALSIVLSMSCPGQLTMAKLNCPRN